MMNEKIRKDTISKNLLNKLPHFPLMSLLMIDTLFLNLLSE